MPRKAMQEESETGKKEKGQRAKSLSADMDHTPEAPQRAQRSQIISHNYGNKWATKSGNGKACESGGQKE